MRRIRRPLLLLTARATHPERTRMVQFLRTEKQMLLERLPERITLTPRERRRLLRFGITLGAKLNDSITIVSYRTFLRWKQKDQCMLPRTTQCLRDLIVKIARETGWGYARVLDELRKLTSSKVSRQFVVNVMREHGFDPGPKRGEQTWDDFIRAHAATLWQCDFFSTRVLGFRGWRECFFIVFLHVGTRRVFLSPATRHPNAEWVDELARGFKAHIAKSRLRCEQLFRDCDGKFQCGFDAIIAARGTEMKKCPIRSPNMKAHVERWIQSIRTECLDYFVPLGERHLNFLGGEFVKHYHEVRPHQGEVIGNLPLSVSSEVDDDVPPILQIGCRERLGGVLKHYYRRAA